MKQQACQQQCGRPARQYVALCSVLATGSFQGADCAPLSGAPSSSSCPASYCSSPAGTREGIPACRTHSFLSAVHTGCSACIALRCRTALGVNGPLGYVNLRVGISILLRRRSRTDSEDVII